MSNESKGLYGFGDFRLDARERLLLRNGEPVSLTPKAFDLLLALVERHGRLVEKEELFREVWPDAVVEESNLSSNVALIRKAIRDGEDGRKFIETVPKRGYRFVGEVQQIATVIEASVECQEEVREPARVTQKWPGAMRVLVVAGSLLIICLLTWWFLRGRAPESSPMQIVPLTALPGSESQPSFSPDGNQIAFVWNGENGDNQDIYVKQIGNENLVRLTSDPAPDTGPAWSPDGKYIAFTRRAEKEIGLFVVPSLGGAERRISSLPLTLLPEFTYRINWTSDSEQVVTVQNGSASEPSGIYVVARETGEKHRIVMSHVDGNPASPAVSPNGKTIAFIAGYADSRSLYLAPVAGGESQKVQFDMDTSVEMPTWMPDGRSILFLSNRASGNAKYLWRIDAAGGKPVRVEGAERDLTSFAVSPRGDRLAWTIATNNSNIWRLDLAQSNKPASRPLISSTKLEVDPRISPDGRKIAFSSSRSGSMQMWVCNSDGSHPLQLTFFKDSNSGSPRWSPDGHQIAFDNHAGLSLDVYIVSVDGGKPQRITKGASKDVLPSWSRDGKWLYFCSDRSGSEQIWKTPVSGGQLTQVTRKGGFECQESVDGRFLYYTKGYRVVGIWRLPVAGGEEELVLDHNGIGQWRYWTVADNGIWFATAQQPERPVVEYYDFPTRKISTITTLDRKIGFVGFAGLDVSPDARWMIWSQMDQVGSDIMLTEKFR